MIPDAVAAWHMGGLHPIETLLVLLLAFGPFVIAGSVVLVRRRRNASEPPEAEGGKDSIVDPADTSGR